MTERHNPTPLLEVENLGIHFGGLQAVAGFGLLMNEGDLKGIIGPNGAGKTTVFNMLTGIYAPSEGSIKIRGESIAGKKIHEVTHCGIARTFQNIRLFQQLSVLDNLKIARHSSVQYSFWASLCHGPEVREEERAIEEEGLALLERLGMKDLARVRAGGLPYGMQRRLEIARALATKPSLLLLDEPAAGMNPQEVDHLAETILWVKKEFQVTILLIEHHMKLVMEICDHITVMNFGKTIAEGPPDRIKTDPTVIEAYLGKGGTF
ncbi:MAG: ABC transporter ATP-binding protein [Synergistaceae bacterium]|jgi:branched-chain amino acid transport system ATP-binding protein|nr:ABC transporter ATP-binding protein [Synergistaceae bacterium]